jgi:hypothetical protein
MVYLPTKFNKSASNDPLFAPMKLDGKANFRTSATTYYILHHPATSSYILYFLLLHRAFLNLKLVIYQQMHYLLHLERFNITQEIT